MFLNRGDSINDAGTVVVLKLHKLQVVVLIIGSRGPEAVL